jgi:hypothetical protein
MEYLFRAWTWIDDVRSACLVTFRVPKVFPKWGSQWRIHRDVRAANKKKEKKKINDKLWGERISLFSSQQKIQSVAALFMWR